MHITGSTMGMLAPMFTGEFRVTMLYPTATRDITWTPFAIFRLIGRIGFTQPLTHAITTYAILCLGHADVHRRDIRGGGTTNETETFLGEYRYTLRLIGAILLYQPRSPTAEFLYLRT